MTVRLVRINFPYHVAHGLVGYLGTALGWTSDRFCSIGEHTFRLRPGQWEEVTIS